MTPTMRMTAWDFAEVFSLFVGRIPGDRTQIVGGEHSIILDRSVWRTALVYYESLCDIPLERVRAAVERFIHDYPEDEVPTIAHIRRFAGYGPEQT
jgi:hypothetical protein